MANLSPEQRAQVESWAAEGATLNQIQERLKADFNVTLTYLDARLLMLDIGVKLKDKPRESHASPMAAKPAGLPAPMPGAAAGSAPPDEWADDDDFDVSAPGGSSSGTAPAAHAADAPAGKNVKLTLDEITLPSAMVSGKVTFSDGTKASWYVDQLGRLGLGGVPAGYQPPPADVAVFQRELDRLLQQQGF